MNNHIEIEKFSAQDFDKYYELVGNENVMAMITERAISREAAIKDFEVLLTKNRRHKFFGSFKVFELTNNHFIGLAKLEINENNREEAELGYMLLPEFWGKGLGSEIAKLLIDKAILESNLNKVFAIIDPNNIPSLKILKRNGFVSGKVCEIDGLPGEILSRKV